MPLNAWHFLSFLLLVLPSRCASNYTNSSASSGRSNNSSITSTSESIPIAIDPYQTHTGPYTPVPIDEEKDCVLWDPKCVGRNRTEALVDFFNETFPKLVYDACFFSNQAYGNDQPGDLRRICPETKHVTESTITPKVLSWARSPQCQSAEDDWRRIQWGEEPEYDTGSCCGFCEVGAPNVDVYYWPSPDANTSCLSIIGDHLMPPLDQATTHDCSSDPVGSTLECGTYWGSMPPTNDPNYPYASTFATLETINGIQFKLLKHNPWETRTGFSAGQWGQNLLRDPSTSATVNLTKREKGDEVLVKPNFIPLRARAPSNGTTTANVKPGPSLLVTKGQTLTSPSVYVDFYSLSATDDCGYIAVSSKDYIESTMIAFDPDELSTVGAPLDEIVLRSTTDDPLPTSKYNFADLPCPPVSVMSAQWYSPEPGVPYRPFLALPSKILKVIPEFQRCSRSATNFFIGLDPPRTLEAAQAMVPTVTPAADAGPKPDPAMPAVSPAHPAFKTTQSQAIAVPTPAPATDPQQNKPPSNPNQQDPMENDPKAQTGNGGGQGDGEKQTPQDPPSPDKTSDHGHDQQDPPEDHQGQDPAPKEEDPGDEDVSQGGSPNDSNDKASPPAPASQDQGADQGKDKETQDHPANNSNDGEPKATSQETSSPPDAAADQGGGPEQQQSNPSFDASGTNEDQLSGIINALKPSSDQGQAQGYNGNGSPPPAHNDSVYKQSSESSSIIPAPNNVDFSPDSGNGGSSGGSERPSSGSEPQSGNSKSEQKSPSQGQQSQNNRPQTQSGPSTDGSSEKGNEENTPTGDDATVGQAIDSGFGFFPQPPGNPASSSSGDEHQGNGSAQKDGSNDSADKNHISSSSSVSSSDNGSQNNRGAQPADRHQSTSQSHDSSSSASGDEKADGNVSHNSGSSTPASDPPTPNLGSTPDLGSEDGGSGTYNSSSSSGSTDGDYIVPGLDCSPREDGGPPCRAASSTAGAQKPHVTGSRSLGANIQTEGLTQQLPPGASLPTGSASGDGNVGSAGSVATVAGIPTTERGNAESSPTPSAFTGDGRRLVARWWKLCWLFALGAGLLGN